MVAKRCDIKHFAHIYMQMPPDILKIPNRWNQIDDFGWLKSEQSPHFSLLIESERLKDDIWGDIVSDEHRLSLDDVLKIVNVRP